MDKIQVEDTAGNRADEEPNLTVSSGEHPNPGVTQQPGDIAWSAYTVDAAGLAEVTVQPYIWKANLPANSIVSLYWPNDDVVYYYKSDSQIKSGSRTKTRFSKTTKQPPK
ncbi:hypothetical protein ACOI9X_15780 [Pseudomonas sp. P2757]|uniref:hypothetical protein n=1 Tax=unclassified Pseudomonas TaxID=196821 RepID=UPI003B5BA821